MSQSQSLKNSSKIDAVIKNRTLDKHPEFLENILRLLGITSFWNSINESEDHIVLRPLATNRVLNFYELGCVSDLTYSEFRVGITALILSATIDKTSIATDAPSTSTLVPFFLRCTSLAHIAALVKLLKPEELEQVTELIRAFSRGRPSRDTLAKKALNLYVYDACRMWPLAGDTWLNRFFNGQNRLWVLDDRQVSDSVQSNLGTYCASSFSCRGDFIFDSKWGHLKVVRHNLPAKLSFLA